jgi:hypothetical protein
MLKNNFIIAVILIIGLIIGITFGIIHVKTEEINEEKQIKAEKKCLID